MGTAQRKPHSALVEKLLAEPGSFDFFRAVKVLEAEIAVRKGRAGRHGTNQVGFDQLGSEVGLKFRSAASLAFPARTLNRVQKDGEQDDEEAAFEVLVSFLGLVGSSGTLPSHYTEILLQRRHARDRSLRDFLDAFQERGISFFYRAFSKYDLPSSYESGNRERGLLDPITEALCGITGLLPRRRGKRIGDEELSQVHHAGLFSDRRRSAHGLRAMMAGLLGCPVRVEQFVGEWVDLDPNAQSRLGGQGAGTPAVLGEEAVLGARVWAVDTRVRVIAGPLERDRFRDLWPGGAPVRFLWEMLRAYLGPLIECDLVWELLPDAPAVTRLGGDQRLGRDCWLGWSESGGPDTRVPSPAWHNSRSGLNPVEPVAVGV